jgi:arachidonate 15-lipoxygenase
MSELQITTVVTPLPTLPQKNTPDQQKQRQFQLSLARTNYNYMHTYMEHVPMAAGLPEGEKFTLDFINKVLKVILPMAENFQKAVLAVLKRELESDLPTVEIAELRAALHKLEEEFSALRPVRDIKDIHEFLQAVTNLLEAMQRLERIPKDLEKMATGMKAVFAELIASGPTAFLKSTMFDMLSTDYGRDYLRPETIDDYEALFGSLKKPLMLSLSAQPWMNSTDKPCEQDWYFGWMQIAGYNTTLLNAVVASALPNSDTVALSDLQKKMPISDAILQGVTGDKTLTLAAAIAAHRLYVVDYVQFANATADSLHGEQRYITAPIALFYWNPTPPPGYPPTAQSEAATRGVMQPIAIQLGQSFDAELRPIFTPNDCANSNDPNHLKWRIAKFFVNALGAMHHESIAHLGDCHLIIEPTVVAARRQLADQHPILKLLIPHFRFTININDDAIHGLIAPGGVVATNVGPTIECTLEAVGAARAAYRWDERNPDRLFQRRGVDKLPVFPFRDDTLLIYAAIKPYVSDYLRLYYQNDQDVRDDNELQAFVNELVLPQYASFKGMLGLVDSGDAKQPVRIESLDYLIQLIAQIIYVAGPQHSSVNFAQYAMMSYMPAVAGTIYQPPPTRATALKSLSDCLAWYPPLDVALYTFSFEYLLTEVQYDTFGHYESDPRSPYFNDARAQTINANLHDALALAEIEIRRRNTLRPMPYPFQLPSQILNSVSI